MAKDAVATMGTVLTDDVGGRDAVHVAVISVEAGHKLQPGDHIGKRSGDGDKLVVAIVDHAIGIVDPFLEGPVYKGQRFWLYLYPRTITSLRHNWTHPEFEDVQQVYAAPSELLVSKIWMDNFAGRYGFTGSYAIDRAKEFIDGGNYWSDGGTFEGEHIPDEFWEHYEKLTGKVVEENKRHSFFSCSC